MLHTPSIYYGHTNIDLLVVYSVYFLVPFAT